MYKYAASGYLVRDNKVLLVHHNTMGKWVPPGGHMEEDETPAQTAEREFFEETNIHVTAISIYPNAFAGDGNATPIPIPFHMDLEREGFAVPHILFFYFVKMVDSNALPKRQESELKDIGWFSKEELMDLKTFEQVRQVATFALDNYPS